MRRLTLFATLSVASAIAACVIGPKQDDPAAPTLVTDTGVLDPDVGSQADDSGDPAAATEAGADTSPGLIADAAQDSAGDACPDGGVPLAAYGPWNGGKACYKARVVLECVAGFDAGLTFTCFAQVSTGDLYLSETTARPSGADYRACTDEERARVKSSPELCK